MNQNEMAACLAAARDDVSRIFQGYQVPDQYRERLTAYIQRWYLDQGSREPRVCLPPEPAQPATL